jgi:HAD superfamily hydrolase (TIGR01509 family)
VAGGCLILDFDGTILDTEGPVYQSWAELWADHGQELDLAEWQRVIGTDAGFDPWLELETRLGRSLPSALQQQRLARREELQARHTIRPGIRDWLEDAAGTGIPVGVASSSPAEWVQEHVERLGLGEFFGCMVCAGGPVPAKPDPTSYRLACRRLGAAPGCSVAVEDSPHGVAAAVGAGLYTVAVPHPLTAGLDLSAADVVRASLEGLSLTDALARAAGRSLPPASGPSGS